MNVFNHECIQHVHEQIKETQHQLINPMLVMRTTFERISDIPYLYEIQRIHTFNNNSITNFHIVMTNSNKEWMNTLWYQLSIT